MSLVNLDKKLVHIRLLLAIVYLKECRQYSIEAFGITLGDISNLAKLLWPKHNAWWSEYINAVPEKAILPIKEQLQFLDKSYSPTEKTNFEDWVGESQEKVGEWHNINETEIPY